MLQLSRIVTGVFGQFVAAGAQVDGVGSIGASTT
jgi:hypothetical protein